MWAQESLPSGLSRLHRWHSRKLRWHLDYSSPLLILNRQRRPLNGWSIVMRLPDSRASYTGYILLLSRQGLPCKPPIMPHIRTEYYHVQRAYVISSPFQVKMAVQTPLDLCPASSISLKSLLQAACRELVISSRIDKIDKVASRQKPYANWQMIPDPESLGCESP